MMRTSELILSKKSSQTRSWRRTVAHAVALAKWAVELDSRNTDPMGALDAYTESVRHLRSILARLERHGAHSEASRLATIVRCRPLLQPLCPGPVLNDFANGSASLIASGCACCAWCVRYRRRHTTTPVPSATTARHKHHLHYCPHPRTTDPAVCQHGRGNPCKTEIIIPAKGLEMREQLHGWNCALFFHPSFL